MRWSRHGNTARSIRLSAYPLTYSLSESLYSEKKYGRSSISLSGSRKPGFNEASRPQLRWWIILYSSMFRDPFRYRPLWLEKLTKLKPDSKCREYSFVYPDNWTVDLQEMTTWSGFLVGKRNYKTAIFAQAFPKRSVFPAKTLRTRIRGGNLNQFVHFVSCRETAELMRLKLHRRTHKTLIV